MHGAVIMFALVSVLMYYIIAAIKVNRFYLGYKYDPKGRSQAVPHLHVNQNYKVSSDTDSNFLRNEFNMY